MGLQACGIILPRIEVSETQQRVFSMEGKHGGKIVSRAQSRRWWSKGFLHFGSAARNRSADRMRDTRALRPDLRDEHGIDHWGDAGARKERQRDPRGLHQARP